MKEQLYTIPVNEAFETDCECPLCKMKSELEHNAIEYTLGPSYMEDDNRAMTDETGFCEKHIQLLYQEKNRLGLALILSTHMQKTTRDLEEYAKEGLTGKTLFKKGTQHTKVGNYTKHLKDNCFICNRMENTFNRYIDTIFHLYQKDDAFSHKIRNSKGFCTYHYGLLFDKAPQYFSKELLSQFIDDINTAYFENMKRMQEDIEWFINKFDHRYKDAPWKNSKDALIRAIQKTHETQPPIC